MDDHDRIVNRIRNRKGNVLNDHNFNIFYTVMIRMMILIVVIISSLIITKDNNIQDTILNNQLLNDTCTWISNQVLSYLPSQQEVSNEIIYTNTKDNLFTSDSNEVIVLNKGRVVTVDKNNQLGMYVVVVSKDFKITYGNLKTNNVKKYQNVKKKQKIGTYQDSLIINFEYLGKEISYEQYQGME